MSEAMPECPRDFLGGVWDGQTRMCKEEATAQVVGIPVIGATRDEPATLWSGYLLRGDDFHCIITGTREECELTVARRAGV